MASEEMPILADQVIGAYPLRVCCDEGVCWFEAGHLVFGSKFKWNYEILIDLSEAPDERKDFPKDIPRKVSADFIDDEMRYTDCVDFKMADECIEQRYRSRFLSDSEGKEILVAIEDEAQPFLPKASLVSSGEPE